MSIIYAMIGRNQKVVLSEYTEYKGKFPAIAREVLTKLTPETRQTIGLEDKYYHAITSNNIHYMCYTNGDYNKVLIFGFLTKLKETILEEYPYEKIMSTEDSGLPVQDIIKRTIDEFNSKDDLELLSKSQVLIKKVGELKEEVVQNLSRLLERDNLLDELLEKTKALEGVSVEYVNDTKKLKCKMKQRYIIYGVIMFVALLLVVYIIMGIVCGFTFKCFRKSQIGYIF
jgi:hypothetical protein